MKKARKEAK